MTQALIFSQLYHNIDLTLLLLNQSGIVIKFDNPDQNKPIANRCTDSSSRDTLSRKQFLIQYGVLRPNQTI